MESGIDAGVSRGLYEMPAGPFTYRRFPSTWLFITHQLARVVVTVGGNRRIQGSDLADAHHVSGGAYYDVLVTDDGALREVVSLMPIAPRTMTSSKFNDELPRL